MIPTLFADINETFWFPKQASKFAPDVDWLYNWIVIISVVFFVPIVAAMIYFTIKYRERPGYKGSIEALHNTIIGNTVVENAIITVIEIDQDLPIEPLTKS